MTSKDITPNAPFEETPEQARTSLMEHLQELRTRLIRAFIAVGVGFAVAYWFADHLFQALTWPIREVSGGKVLLIGTGVGEGIRQIFRILLANGRRSRVGIIPA